MKDNIEKRLRELESKLAAAISEIEKLRCKISELSEFEDEDCGPGEIGWDDGEFYK